MKKHLSSYALCLLFMLAFATFLKAQAPFWKLNGNPATGADLVNTGNNFIGTGFGAPNNNTFMKMGVNFSQDIFIDNLPGAPQILPNSSGSPQGGHWVGLGNIFQPSVGPGAGILNPKAHLHIHGNNTTGSFGFAGGIRNWFQTGTLYTENSDGMYTGLRNLGTNQSYAVINWSDDAFGTTGTDYLSFNFTGGPGPLAATTDGVSS